MRYDYSNLGFGLLGYVLGRVWNTSWDDAPRVLRAAIPATHVNHHPGRTPAAGLGWFLD